MRSSSSLSTFVGASSPSSSSSKPSPRKLEFLVETRNDNSMFVTLAHRCFMPCLAAMVPRRRRNGGKLAWWLLLTSTTLCLVITFLTLQSQSNVDAIGSQPALVQETTVNVLEKFPEFSEYIANQRRNCTEKDQKLCVFHRQMLTTNERKKMADVLQQCSKVLDNLPDTGFFLYGTSLLGFYRHNASIVPWEDFVNIALFATNPKLNYSTIVKRFHRLVKTLLPPNAYSIRYDKNQHIIKCYGLLPENSQRITDASIFWRWPYVEIQIMTVKRRSSSGEIVKISDPNWSEFAYPVEMVLPLQKVTFEGVQVYVPKEAQLAVERNYNPYTCRAIYYDHRREETVPSSQVVSMPCKDLKRFVKFSNTMTQVFDDDEAGLPNCELGRQRDDPYLCSFLPVLSPQEKSNVLELIKVCIGMLEQVTDGRYFLYGGTLIGYWRHGGSMIPWDDDADFAFFQTNSKANDTYYVNQMKKIIRQYPGYTIHYMASPRKVKCFGNTAENSRRIIGDYDYSWRWPFVDIQLMRTAFDDDGKIVNISDTSEFSDFQYPADLIFPLQRAVFENIATWVPNQVEKALKLNYDIHDCTAPYYNHRFERSVSDERQVTRPCVQLTSIYAFTNLDSTYYDVS